MLQNIWITVAAFVAYLDLSSLLADSLGSNISIFKVYYFTVHLTAFLKKICTKYPKCYYFHSASVMKTVSNSHFQFSLKPCVTLKINLKIGKNIWLKLNCGYCNYYKFFVLKLR